MSSLEDDLTDVVGAGNILFDPDLTAGYERDWTGRFGGRSRAVVRPADVAQTAEAVKVCARHQIPLVPRVATPAWSARASRATTRSYSA